MDATSTAPWWITECDGQALPVMAPSDTLAGIYAAATYQRETGRWPRTTTTPRPATRDEIATWARIVTDIKRRADNDPNYTPTSLTDASIAYLPLALTVTAGDIPSIPDYRTPPAKLIERSHLAYIFGNLAQLWGWVLISIAPLIVSAIYWSGHYLEWWTAFGWDRDLGWFTNRGVLVGYLLWLLVPIQSLWFLGWVLATDRWVDEHITSRPYFGGSIGAVSGAAPFVRLR